MQAVILAAGMGFRLGDLTKDRPKALVRVAGRELILRVMDFLDHPAITSRLVVTGHMADRLNAFLKENCPGVKCVDNPNFSDGSIRSIETALPFIDGDFLVMNTDHIYPRRMMNTILKQRRGISAVCDFDRKLAADDMKVKLDGEDCLLKIRKTLDEFDAGYIGMTFCSAAELPAYRRAVADTCKKEGDAASVEFALGQLADGGHKINICNASGIRWLEVDTPDDLANAEAKLNQNPGFLS